MGSRGGDSRWRAISKQCFLRDRTADAPCGICKGELGPIDYAAKPSSSALSYEPDHIRPWKNFPELRYEPANIQASHMTCNRSKQDKAGMTNLGNQSRNW